MHKQKSYDRQVHLQPDNQESSGRVLPQNQHHNIKKEALGPNTKRSK